MNVLRIDCVLQAVAVVFVWLLAIVAAAGAQKARRRGANPSPRSWRGWHFEEMPGEVRAAGRTSSKNAQTSRRPPASRRRQVSALYSHRAATSRTSPDLASRGHPLQLRGEGFAPRRCTHFRDVYARQPKPGRDNAGVHLNLAHIGPDADLAASGCWKSRPGRSWCGRWFDCGCRYGENPLCSVFVRISRRAGGTCRSMEKDA